MNKLGGATFTLFIRKTRERAILAHKLQKTLLVQNLQQFFRETKETETICKKKRLQAKYS